MNTGMIIAGCAVIFVGAMDQVIDAIRPRSRVIPLIGIFMEGVGLFSVILGT